MLAVAEKMQDCEPDASTVSAAQTLTYRQRLEKPAGGEVALMKWSPTMDLLAATFKDNSVCLYTTARPDTRRRFKIHLRMRRLPARMEAGLEK